MRRVRERPDTPSGQSKQDKAECRPPRNHLGRGTTTRDDHPLHGVGPRSGSVAVEPRRHGLSGKGGIVSAEEDHPGSLEGGGGGEGLEQILVAGLA